MLIRYPGSKRKIMRYILPRIDLLRKSAGHDAEYREPFVGAGAVALPLLRANPDLRRAWINDRDPSIAALWDCVLHRGRSLKMLVHLFPKIMNPKYFYFYKKILLGITEPGDLGRYDACWVGFIKIATHQISFSGLGTRAGGPMGGREQRGLYAFGCRYNPARIGGKIDSCHETLSRVQLRHGTCSCLDFDELFAPGEAFFYLDPPYYQEGAGLYQFPFAHADHERLSGRLRRESRPWLLSYDRHPTILDLYQGWARIVEIPASYAINGHTQKTELLICNDHSSLDREIFPVTSTVSHAGPPSGREETEMNGDCPVPSPDESWTLDRLGSYASESIEESLRLSRRSTIEVYRAGHALSLARDRHRGGRAWGVWLKSHGIRRTGAWEAIELYRRAGSEERLANLTITEAKQRLGIVSQRARDVSRSPGVGARSNPAEASKPATRADDGTGPVRAATRRARGEWPVAPDVGIDRGGDDDTAPPGSEPWVFPGEPGAPPMGDDDPRGHREPRGVDGDGDLDVRSVTNLILEHVAVLWDHSVSDEEIEEGAGIRRGWVRDLDDGELGSISIPELDRLSAWFSRRRRGDSGGQIRDLTTIPRCPIPTTMPAPRTAVRRGPSGPGTLGTASDPPPKEDPNSAISVLAKVVARLDYLSQGIDAIDWSGGGAGEAHALTEYGVGLFRRIGAAITAGGGEGGNEAS